MKQIQYTGSSKLISRIVHLLNRKAPLPLDGDGDAEWGTNGQVLTTDGQGNTSWTDKGGGGGGSTVSYTQTLASGTKTGEIEIDGVSTNMYAPTPPTNTSDLNNDSGFITSADVPTKTSDLTNDSGFITSADVPTKTSDLTNDSGFITNLVNDLANYYTKSQTYTQAEVDALISGIVTLNILVVQTLPTQDISTTTIYLVPKQDTGTSDIYDEYLYINNAWELIGTTQIDLSNYYTKTETDTLLNAKVSDNPTFTEASTRANIASGESFATILGKIKKFFSDLKTVAFTGAYADLSGTENVAGKNIDNYFSATQHIDNQSGTTSAVGVTNLIVGNNKASGTDKNTRGQLLLYGNGSNYGLLRAQNVTAAREYELPNKNGTIALTSDLDSRVDWVSNGIIGAKNAFAITLDILKKSNTSGTWNDNAYTINNIVFTVNLDTNGNVTSITANGLASGDASLTIGLFGIANGDYILSGCPAGGNESSTYFVALGDGVNRIATDIGSGRSFSVTTNAISGLIRIKSGYNAQNLNFYPMIRLATDTDATFQPYAMTNLELTNAVQYSSEIVTTGAGSSIAVGFYKFGKVVCVRFANGYYTAEANASLFLIPLGYEPVDVVDFRDTYSNKRINGGGYGREREMYCTEALSNTAIRGTFCYICE